MHNQSHVHANKQTTNCFQEAVVSPTTGRGSTLRSLERMIRRDALFQASEHTDFMYASVLEVERNDLANKEPAQG